MARLVIEIYKNFQNALKIKKKTSLKSSNSFLGETRLIILNDNPRPIQVGTHSENEPSGMGQ
jgi:hypothetical protein